jgi:hypothetical protein
MGLGCLPAKGDSRNYVIERPVALASLKLKMDLWAEYTAPRAPEVGIL